MYRFHMLPVLALLLPAASAAQEPEWLPVDRIVAVVGSIAIPDSRLVEELNFFFQANGGPPDDEAALRAIRTQVLNRMIDEEVVVQAAERDTTVVVSDQDVASGVDDSMRRIRQQYATEAEYQNDLRAAGFENEQVYREFSTRRQRRDLLRTNYLGAMQQKGEVREAAPSLEEMQAYYDATKDQWPQRPATVSFRQIVIKPNADSAAFAETMTRADSLVAELRGGADFATAARRFSQDPGSRDQGGDLGFFRRGKMHRNFERVAFGIRPGVISDPVVTPFGIHIIEVMRAEPAEVQARHILLMPPLSPENNRDAGVLADSLKALLIGGAPLDSLTRLYHDDSEQAVVEEAPIEQLPPAYAAIFSSASPGSILGPLMLPFGPSLTKYAVVVFAGQRAAGPATFEDMQERIRSALSRENGIKRFVNNLRDHTYIDIRL